MDFFIKMNNIQLLQFVTACLSEFKIKIMFLSGQSIIKFMIIVKDGDSPVYIFFNIHTVDRNIKCFEDILTSDLRGLRSFRFDIEQMFIYYQRKDSEESNEIMVNESLKLNLIASNLEEIYDTVDQITTYIKIIINDICDIQDINII